MSWNDDQLCRLIVAHSPHGAAILFPRPLRLRFANQAVEAFSGYGLSELLAMRPHQLRELIHQEDRAHFTEMLDGLLAGEPESTRADLRFVRRDGSVLWGQCWARSTEVDGLPAVLLTINDDTERRRAVEALRRSEAKLLQAQYIARIGDFTWDIATGAVTWSDGMYRLLKYDPNQAIDLARVNTEVRHPDDLERVTSWLNAGIASGVGVLEPNEYRLVCADGEVLHVQTNGRFELQNGKAVRLFGTCQDITKRKRAEDALRESEQRLLAAQQLANLGDWWWDVGTGEVEWSEQVYEIFRVDPKDFTPQIDSILALSPWPEDHQRDEELIRRAIESREAGSYEQRFLRPDGSVGHYASSFLGVYDDHGRLVAMRGTVQDITARKEAEAEKDRLLQQLHQSQKMESIGRLAGGVAHDFNNTLCAIIGQVELALDEPSINAHVRTLMDGVLECSDRAARLTRQLLAFSRKQVIEPQIVDLSELIQRLHPMLVRLIAEDVRLRTVPQPHLGRVKVDPVLVEQIVLNLAVNARDAMPEGGELLIETCNVELDTEYCESHATGTPGDYVMLAVSDTGVGIPENIRDKIFEPFFTTKARGEGTGLGLATVLGIVEQNHGRLEVYSEPGHGTTFKVYFPVVSAQVEGVGRSQTLRSMNGRETVLVVEDESVVRTPAVQLLRSRGFEVLAAGSGEEALAVVDRHEGTIDLLLTDVVMPGMNGRELARLLVHRRPHMKVLFTSGYTDNVIAQHGVLDEGLDFLSKPYSRDSLVAKVREILDAPCRHDWAAASGTPRSGTGR